MKTILVLVDFSERSKNAATYAFAAAIHYKANILLYNAYYVLNTVGTEGGGSPLSQYYSTYEEYENQSMRKLKKLGEELSLSFDKKTAKLPQIDYLNDLGRVGDNITEVLKQREIWFAVMGEKRNIFLDNLLAGSDSANILRNATCPVLLIPEKVRFSPFSLITLASSSVDEHELSALNFVTELTDGTEAEIRIVHVISQNESSNTSAQKINTEIFNKNISYYTIKGKDIGTTLMEYIKRERSYLIVLVRKEYDFFESLFHSSITKKIIDNHLAPSLIYNS